MTRPLRLEFKNAFYHVLSRGDRKDLIFKENEYKLKFIEKMNETFIKYNVNCIAYCIMNNHYHLYLNTPDGNLIEAIQYLNTSYSNWYKSKTQKVGHVFQGRYKSILIDSENYSISLVNYIHLNPVKAKLVNKPEDYKFSTLNYYLGIKRSIIENLNKSFILNKFDLNTKIAIEKYYLQLTNNIDNYEMKKSIYKSLAIGNNDFITQIEKKLKEIPLKIEVPTTHMTKTRYSDKIIKNICKYYKIKKEIIFKQKYKNFYKKITIYILKNNTRMKLREIGDLFGLKYTSISLICSRFQKEIDNNHKLQEQIQKICKM